ncbi:uncharacterized protein LOC128236124 isoform X2 [Mya arenaria]|uniref:uncharacterized protein LOC128236124 isoform X2 n=1 Tax=Mya arenaria TaxID=6604 RepID=UPI0022E1EFA5|nr:uncharacterized protein LOC128236124 isoform X2 [Mya arenaria]
MLHTWFISFSELQSVKINITKMCNIILCLWYMFWMFLFKCADGSVTIDSSAATVPEGSSLTFTCTYTGNEHLFAIRWTNNGNNSGRKYDITIQKPEPCTLFDEPGLNKTLFTYTCLTLTILNVTRDYQNDNFTCQANLNINSGNSVIVRVSVPISTVDLTSPTAANVTVNAGSSQKFTCRTSGGFPQPTVEWYKTSSSNCTRNGVKIMNSIPSSPSESNGLIQVESSLLFTTSSSDNNLWICCAASNINSQWKLSGTKLLDVRYPPPNPPVIDDFNTIPHYQMIENMTERFTCRSTGGNPLASLTWSCYNGIVSNPNISGGSVSRSVQFTARRNQDKTCTCNATHEAGLFQQATLDVNILYPPSTPEFKVDGTPVGIAISIVKDDSDQTVTCHSFGKPNPSENDFTWTKESAVVSSNSVLSWTGGIRIQDGGSYKCTVTTTMTPSDTSKTPVTTEVSSDVTMDVLYSPRLHQLSRLNALEGENITLKCEYEPGNPTETTVLIARLNDRITWTDGTHFIPSLKRTDAGMYNCTVRNIMQPTGQLNEIVGMDTGIFQVNVWYKTSVSKFGLTSHPDANNVTVDENATLNFFCEVDSNPNSTIVFGRSDRLLNNTTLKKNDGFLHLAFDVQQADCLDTASYYCFGYNNYTEIETAPRKQMDVYVRCSPRASGGQWESNITGAAGGNATFSFDVVAYPVPNKDGYVWHKWNGTTYSQLYNSDKYTINNAGVSTTFTINAIEQEDFSTYLLTVSNGIIPDFNELFNLRSQEDELERQKTHYEVTITGLKDGSTYDVIMFSRNEKGNCKQNNSLQFDTELLVDDPPLSNTALIGGLAGGISAVCVAFFVVVVVLFLRKRMSYKKGESRQALTKGQKLRTLNAVEEDADDLPDEVENPMYESSQPAAMKQDSPDVLYALPKKKDGDIYAVVDKANKRPTKSQGTKKQKNDAHDNAGFDIYENNQSPQHPAKKNVNHDGLVYADIVFANPPKGQKRLVIHGIDDMTVYADVDLNKKVDPFPHSDEEDGGKKEPNKK